MFCSRCSIIRYQVGFQRIEVSFLGIFLPLGRYKHYSTKLGKYMASTRVVFLEITPFFYAPPISTSQEKEDEWFVYQVTRFLTGKSYKVVLPFLSTSIEH